MFLEDYAQIPSKSNWIPCISPDDVIFRLDAQLSKDHQPGWRELSLRTFLYVKKLQTTLGCIHSDVSATRPDAFQCSTRKMILFQKYRYGKIDTTIRTMCVLVQTLSLIRQVVHTKFNRLDVSLHGPDAHALIWKLRAAEVQPVRTLGQHRPDAALFGKEFQAYLESWLHSCLSGRRRDLGFCGLQIETSRHVFCKNSVVNFIVLREFILEFIVLIRSLSSRCCAELKSILRVGPKVKDFIEDSFK